MLAMLLAASLAAPVPKVAKKPDDAQALLGRWQSVEVKYDGRAGAVGAVFRFGADGRGGVVPPNGDAEKAAEYTLDATAAPKRLVWGLNGSKQSVATYELDGDTLKLAFGSSRVPPEKAAPGPDVSYYELKRLKDDK